MDNDDLAAASLRVTDFSVLIVDDEPLARIRVRRVLAGMPGVTIVGEAGDIEEAAAMIVRFRPDIVTLDIQLPGGSGFELLEQLGSEAPATIFVTAFDHHAQRAFDMQGVDYVTKPVNPNRLRVAVERACAQLRARSNEERVGELQEIVASLRRAMQETDDVDTDFWVRSRSEYRRIPARQITHIRAEGDYVRIFSGGESFLHHESLASIETRLAAKDFIRVHRSTIARRDAILRLLTGQFSALTVELIDGSKIRVGRTYTARIRAEVSK